MSLERDREVLAYVHSDILQSGEKIIWKGRPAPGRAMKVDVYLFLFGLFWLGFSLFWISMASRTGGMLFSAFGIPFVLMGIFLVSSPLRNRRRAGRTYYAVTNQRVLIVTAGRRYKINAYAGRDITHYQRSDGANGQGDIRLRKTNYNRNANIFTLSAFADGLWGIEDIKGASDAVTPLTTA